MNDKIKFIINLAVMLALIIVYTCNIARAYSVNIMFPPITVCDYSDQHKDDEKKEIRFKMVEMVMDLFKKY